MKQKIMFIVILLFFLPFFFNGGVIYAGDVTVIDSRHYSNVFGEMRNYRIFLPPGYNDNPIKEYPVIYYLHGFSHRYFGYGPIDGEQFEKENENNGDNITNFVSNHEIIVVKSDGYNRNPEEENYLRPYNIGNRSQVDTYRQFPIYYPELINYIDETYRTIADREHRAITGHSMGGFMTFWIGGKYPHLFSAAGNFCGSEEFMVGPRNFPVEYRHMDMYKNYGGMKVRLNYGNQDFIRSYHRDLNKVWPQVMDNYEFKIYNAGHSTCGLSEMFEYFLRTFNDPPKKPLKWTHIDVYPVFTVWDYNVISDRNVSGFTILENVNDRGFKCSVREFLPDGELLSFVNVSVITPPLYDKNKLYIINDLDTKRLKMVQKEILSDNAGRLKINMNGSYHEIGINQKDDKPNICIASFEIEASPWITPGKEIALSVKLLNKGITNGKNIIAKLSATRISTEIVKSESAFGTISSNEVKECQIPFVFHIQSDSIEIVQFRLAIQDDNKNEWYELFEIPVKRDLPEIKDFLIADGKTVTVAKVGIDTETMLLGSGNGDGVANPGESIVILVKDQGTFRRTNLCFSDIYVNPFGINTRKSDDWKIFDGSGASNKYAVPLIASDCPENHVIDFFVEYWLPDYPLHIIKQGIVKLKIKGKDNTPPKLSWVQIPGDNILRIKLYDGSKIQSVKARLVRVIADPDKNIEIELNDEGLLGDMVNADNVFSAKITKSEYGLYRVIIEAIDSFGNILIEEARDKYLLH